MNKILLSSALAFLLVACSDTKKEESTVQKAESTKTIHKETKEPEALKESLTQKSQEAVKTVVEAEKKAAEVVTKSTEELVSKVKEVAAPVVEKVPAEIATVPNVNGESVFASCAGCHGAHAEKKALGKSQVIAGWSVTKVEDALKGYKAGTYGGAMKSIMQGQAKKLSDAQIKAVAEYISHL